MPATVAYVIAIDDQVTKILREYGFPVHFIRAVSEETARKAGGGCLVEFIPETRITKVNYVNPPGLPVNEKTSDHRERKIVEICHLLTRNGLWVRQTGQGLDVVSLQWLTD